MEYIEYELPECYRILFNTVSDAIDAIEEQDFGEAKRLLIQGQLDAEDAFIKEAEEAQKAGKAEIGHIEVNYKYG